MKNHLIARMRQTLMHDCAQKIETAKEEEEEEKEETKAMRQDCNGLL